MNHSHQVGKHWSEKYESNFDAGFVEHVDAQVGKVIDELERLGVRDNTTVI